MLEFDINNLGQDLAVEEEEEPVKLTWPMILDRPRELPEPVNLTEEHLKEIADKLGLIKLAWPEIRDIEFENRVHFPESYLKNSDKEKVLLLYTENFRRQFCHRFPERKPLFLATYNECGLQKMVCTSIRPSTISFCELETWTSCVKFFGNYFKYEPFEQPTIIPNRLYSPHTIFLRQSGQSHELATALCSLLLGAGYDAYVVFGYAARDTTLRILIRVDSPYPEVEEEEKVVEEALIPITSAYNLRSKYSLMLEQREIDKVLAEEARLNEIEQERIREEEKPPPDELEGRRYHAWILLKSGKRDIDNDIFIEPSTGLIHELSSSSYIGIECVWNHLNYWVNMQDCREGLDKIGYDFKNTQNWEHLLTGEPIEWRQNQTDKAALDVTEEEIELQKIMEEKHLDMPPSWSLKIAIPHEALALRYPDGAIRTQYKRTVVEEYAPYTQTDGLLTHIERYSDFDCTILLKTESFYENRSDKRAKLVHDFISGEIHEYFDRGRDDAISDHIYYSNEVDEKQIFLYYNEARHDGLSKIEYEPELMTEEYINRPDRLFYRRAKFERKSEVPVGLLDSSRRVILEIVEKYSRDDSIPADDDIAIREYNQMMKEIKIQYHYGNGRITASSRTFIKPESLEMSREFKFEPKLTYGYQSDINKKPLRLLQLYDLFVKLLDEEKKSIEQVRQIEDLVSEFLNVRNLEKANLQLNIPLFNREQNTHIKLAMLEEEQREKENREREFDDKIEHLAPYLEKHKNPTVLTFDQARDIHNGCLIDLKNVLLERAQDLHRQFEFWVEEISQKEKWYSNNHETITEDQEIEYFKNMNHMHYLLQVLEIRMTRCKDLSYQRYEAMVNYLDQHPLLQILKEVNE